MLQIISAIETRTILSFIYKKSLRKVDVYVLGINGSGEMLIRAYQIGEGWKLFKLSEMAEISNTTTKCYGHKYGYNSIQDKAFIKVIKKVK